jgi:putative oxygen-independent coproporphyrinogen III oxidase
MYEAATAERYVHSLVREIESWREVENADIFDTIYFGGGTPSLLTPAQLKTILDATRKHLKFPTSAYVAEITMEMNPGTVTPEKLAEFRSLGVNRASFGAQTFDDKELSRLGRSHTADDTRRTFCYLRDAGFDNVSFDLIAGLPGQTLDGWRRNLEEAFSLRPEHLSFYLLEVHQGTPLAEHIRRGIQPRPDEDLAAEMYELILDRAGEAGYEHYEISNLCLPGYQSRHNTKYWTGAPYYGFGCSAHSYDGQFRRWANERDLMRYMEAIDRHCSPIASRSQLTEAERQSEAVFLGLRMMQGFNLSDYQKLFGADLRKEYEDDLTRFRQAGLIECTGDLLKLTRAGALLSNEVFSAFV